MSSSSSINNVDMTDRILVPEPEADVDTVIEQQNAVGRMGATADDEESKENLRAKLRSTLSKKQSLPGMFLLLSCPVVAESPPCDPSVGPRQGVDQLVCFCRYWNPTEEEREVDGLERVDRNSPFVGSFSLPYYTDIHQLDPL